VGAEPGRVIIGMDPAQRSVTVEVMTADETVRGGGRYATGHDGYRTMLEFVNRRPDRCG
jgi:transposase